MSVTVTKQINNIISDPIKHHSLYYKQLLETNGNWQMHKLAANLFTITTENCCKLLADVSSCRQLSVNVSNCLLAAVKLINK